MNRGWKPLLRMILERIDIKWDSSGSDAFLCAPFLENAVTCLTLPEAFPGNFDLGFFAWRFGMYHEKE
jgi:hypothetical protein